MTKLHDEIAATLPPGMHIPKPLELLFTWLEEHGLCYDANDGQRTGTLNRIDEDDDEKSLGTEIDFVAEGNTRLKYWLGYEKPEVLNRLCVFARTGGEGSRAAFQQFSI